LGVLYDSIETQQFVAICSILHSIDTRVFSFHPSGVTNQSKSFHLNCFIYPKEEKKGSKKEKKVHPIAIRGSNPRLIFSSDIHYLYLFSLF